MENISVYLFLDERRIKKNKTYPVKIGLVYNRKPYSINIHIDLAKIEWEKTQSNKPGKYMDTKLKLDGILKKANGIIDKMTTFSIDRFKALYNLDQPKTLYLNPLFDSYIQTLKSNNKHSNAESYTSAKRAFHNFYKDLYNKDIIELSEITPKWLEQFEEWWLQKGKSITTVGIYMRNLRCIFNKAIEEELITQRLYPFGVKKYDIPEGRNVKKALQKEQIEQIRNYSPKSDAEEKARDLFLFSYLTFGMNMKDIAMLRYGQIEHHGITFIREKTKSTKRKAISEIFVTLNDELEACIQKYGIIPIEPSKYVFGVVRPDDSSIDKKKKIDQLTKTTNKYLKRIGQELKFDLVLTTYVARHSAASILNNLGAPRNFIQEKLGHSSTKTTENYIDSLDSGATNQWQRVL